MRYFLIISLFFILQNCKKETISSIDLGENYYPLEIGSWYEYTVDSISFSDFTTPINIDTSQFRIKEIIDTTFLDLNQDLNYRVEQFKKSNNTSWIINNIFSLKKTATNIQKVENDLRFIKLTFPSKLNKKWDGNIFINSIDEPTLEYFNPKKYNWDYEYTEIDVKFQVGELSFDSCVVVLQIDDENLFEKKYSKEVYAKNVGLIYKELIILETQAAPSNASFIDRAENGFILIYKISDYKL